MGSMHGEEREKPDLNLEATELRLGLPGGGSEVVKKRGFSETVDLKLNLLSRKEGGHGHGHGDQNKVKEKNSNARLPSCNNDPAKTQVVGWPPVRSFRKNMLAGQKGAGAGAGEEVVEKTTSFNAAFVKVSMDGAPYLRKVDLKMYSTYRDLSNALGNLFSSFTIGNCGSQGMKDFMNESKLMDILSGFDYVSTYEDKDGDWMLVGDVPWEMFVDSCKRLRIMKGKEAIGLAPRAMEKCKNRS